MVEQHQLIKENPTSTGSGGIPLDEEDPRGIGVAAEGNSGGTSSGGSLGRRGEADEDGGTTSAGYGIAANAGTMNLRKVSSRAR